MFCFAIDRPTGVFAFSKVRETYAFSFKQVGANFAQSVCTGCMCLPFFMFSRGKPSHFSILALVLRWFCTTIGIFCRANDEMERFEEDELESSETSSVTAAGTQF